MFIKMASIFSFLEVASFLLPRLNSARVEYTNIKKGVRAELWVFRKNIYPCPYPTPTPPHFIIWFIFRFRFPLGDRCPIVPATYG